MRHAICTMRKIYDGIVCVRIFLVIRVLIFSSSSFEITAAAVCRSHDGQSLVVHHSVLFNWKRSLMTGDNNGSPQVKDLTPKQKTRSVLIEQTTHFFCCAVAGGSSTATRRGGKLYSKNRMEFQFQQNSHAFSTSLNFQVKKPYKIELGFLLPLRLIIIDVQSICCITRCA